MRPRRALVDAAGWAAHALLSGPLRRTSAKLGACVVYHRLAEESAPRGRYFVRPLAASRFERDVQFLTSQYRLVPASALHEAAAARRRGDRFPVAVTFDDDDRSIVDLALPLLEMHSATATFFLTGASLDEPHQFWWEALDELASRSALDPRHVAAELGLIDPGEPGPSTLAKVAERIRRLEPERRLEADRRAVTMRGSWAPARIVDRGAVQDMANRGFEIGFHTRRHFALTTLDDARLDEELRAGRSELAQLAGGHCDTIAYPYGDVDERVANAARAHGFTAGFALLGEPVGAGADPLVAGRVEPSFVSTRVLSLRIVIALCRALLRSRWRARSGQDAATRSATSRL